ncbi:MAG: DMT family transporter [Dehalococcoidia bacterium]|mgnify:CR=1 FL=1
MNQILYIVFSILIGSGMAVQVTMISAMSRIRGPLEATWLSLMATVMGVAALMAYRAFNGVLVIPSPFNRILLVAGISIVAAASLLLVLRGLPFYYFITGLFAIPLLVGAGYLGPKIGIGLFVTATIAGQVIGSVLLDHLGAFGLPIHRVDIIRGAGVITLLLGVALIRGLK